MSPLVLKMSSEINRGGKNANFETDSVRPQCQTISVDLLNRCAMLVKDSSNCDILMTNLTEVDISKEQVIDAAYSRTLQ